MDKSLVELFRSNVTNDTWPVARERKMRCVRVVVFDHARNAMEIINRMRHIENALPKGAILAVPPPYGFQWQWWDFASTVENTQNGAIESVHQVLCQQTPTFTPWGALVWINTAPERGTRWMVGWRDKWHPKYRGPFQSEDISPGVEPPPASGAAVVMEGNP